MSEQYDPLASVQAAGPPGTISFVYGLPDPDTFPVQELCDCLGEVLRRRASLALQYGPEQGYGPLIDYLRAWIGREENLHLERPQMMVTGGSAPTLDLICTLLTRAGDRVLVEAPTYHESLKLLRDHRLVPCQVPTDAHGVIPDALSERLEQLWSGGECARMLYLIPSFQNPSGVTLTLERRREIVALARQHRLLIVEDDVYRELAEPGVVPASLYALGSELTLRLGSFSKLLAPGLRLGWLIGPPTLVRRIYDCGVRNMSGGWNPLIANAIAAYCQKGLLEPHLSQIRGVYQDRRRAMLEALEAYMPPGTEWTRPNGGFFVWLSLPGAMGSAATVARARKKSVLVLPGDPFFAESPTGQYFRLAFSYVEPDQIHNGIRILGEVLAAG
jgi:2-aminoadipate transaminase